MSMSDEIAALAHAQLLTIRALADIAASIEAGQYVPDSQCRRHAESARAELRKADRILRDAMEGRA